MVVPGILSCASASANAAPRAYTGAARATGAGDEHERVTRDTRGAGFTTRFVGYEKTEVESSVDRSAWSVVKSSLIRFALLAESAMRGGS